jgi:Flp pilus assembly protein TadG
MGRFRHREGATAVEFAIVLPILLMLLLGIISVGLLYNQQLTLTQAAREGARFAATLPVDGSYESRVISRVEEVSGGMLDSSNPDDTISVTQPDSDGRLVVRVERDGTLETFVQSWAVRLSAESVARHETEGSG